MPLCALLAAALWKGAVAMKRSSACGSSWLQLEETEMTRLASLASMILLLVPACALAQATSNTMTSGRPSAVLDDAQCQAIWQIASPNGATISQDQAVPYIVNFQLVDGDGDGKISADEFKDGCGKGLVKKTKQ